MAQISEITASEATSVSDNDLFEGEESGGTSFKVAFSVIKSTLKTYFDNLYQNWVEVSDAWSYASASTITVPSGAAAIYQKGDKIRIKQGGAYKYYNNIGTADTVLTVTGGTDYTVANSAITNIAYSRADRPLGFPQEFAFTPTWTNLTIGSGTQAGKFTVYPDRVRGYLRTVFAADTSVSGAINFSVPVTIVGDFVDRMGIGGFWDNDASLLFQAIPHLLTSSTIRLNAHNATSTYGSYSSTSSTVPFTWTTSDRIQVDFEYRY